LRWLLPEPVIYRESAAGRLAVGVVGGLGDIGSSSGLLYVLASARHCTSASLMILGMVQTRAML
jgi:hypothetical protein